MPSAVVTDRRRATTTDLGQKVAQRTSSGEQTVASSRSYDLRTAAASLSQDSLADDFDGPIIDSSGGKVLMDDYELLARAHAVQRRIDFSALTDLARCQWKWKHTKENFTLFTRRLEFHSTTAKKKTLNTHQALVAGEIRCSIEELARILRSASDADYNAVMKGLYKDDFIYGSVVHIAPGSSDQTSFEDQQNENAALPASQLAVKTGCFARANIFVRNEQWCFLEHFQKNESDDAFTVTFATLSERELTVGKIQDGRRVDQLHNLIAAYSVEKIPESESVRVLFHANFDGTSTTSSNSNARNASESMSKSRLMALAKGVSELPEIVRRRRLGIQKLADRGSFSAKNSQCICCTKSLRLLTKKKRCYLCGYFVCDKDWSIQRMETRHGHVTAIRVCARCMECVDSADYANVAVQSLGRASIKPDQPRERTSSSTADSKKAIATFLSDALANSTEHKKESVKAVIQQLVEHEQRLSSEQEQQNRVASKSAPAAYRRSARKLSGDSDDKEYLAALDEYFKIEELPLEKCVLANNEARAYGIKPSEDPTIQPAFPVPRNEARRMSVIEQGNLMKLQNTDELNIICLIAAREMNCSTSIVTIVGPDTQLVLASNLDVFRMVAMPRNQSFCQHTVMDDKPLLVPHPEADVRFANLLPLKELGMKFYCGFPIVDSTNTVVGTVCCLDQKSHDVTRSQYSTMKRLAETASKFVQLKSQEPVAAAGRPITKLFYGQS